MAKNDDAPDTIEKRLIRIETRLVQLMNHVGAAPKGAFPPYAKTYPPKTGFKFKINQLKKEQEDA